MTQSNIVAAVGRIMIAIIFVASGFSKLLHFTATQAYMGAHGMSGATFFLVAAALIELAGGACLILGYYTRRMALVLTAYLVVVTFFMHAFWSQTGAERQMQLTEFMKNLAIMGGLLFVSRVGAFGWSLDQKLHTIDETPDSISLRPVRHTAP